MVVEMRVIEKAEIGPAIGTLIQHLAIFQEQHAMTTARTLDRVQLALYRALTDEPGRREHLLEAWRLARKAWMRDVANDIVRIGKSL